jgi:hypothetical protein
MDDADLRTAIAAQDVAEALTVLGWLVCPFGEDMETWKIGDFVLTDEELISLAARMGVKPAPERVQ